MEVANSLVLALLVAFAFTLGTQAQDQSGFISLSCGSPPNTNFVHSITKINYISDSEFVDSGIGKTVQPKYNGGGYYFSQGRYVRSFPEGKRNCYNFNLTKGDQYMIRATFIYGNYDGLDKDPNFELHLGPNLWKSINFTQLKEESEPRREIIHDLTSNILQICLVKIDDTVPFISVLELRLLKNNPYFTGRGSLETYVNMDVGGRDSYRYDKDYYDRYWMPYVGGEFLDWTNINTSDPFIDYTSSNFKPPLVVMQTASIPTNANKPMTVNTFGEFCVMYFTEVAFHDELIREFNVIYNEEVSFGPIIPSQTPIVYSLILDTGYEFSLEKTKDSVHPPLLNAVEFYNFVVFNHSETDDKEVEAMMSIKRNYRLSQISWQGDPCTPKIFLWEGLNCDYDHNTSDLPTIIYLNLSSIGLTGEILPYISNLTNLSILDLSNNSLTGKIPDFLAGLKSLTILKLSGNNLSGEVPGELLERQKKGSLALSHDGNPNLCHPCNKKKTVIVPVVASVASLLLLAAAFAIILSIKNKKPKNLEARGYSHAGPRRSNGSALMTNNRVFSYSAVQKMTNNFNSVLGKGGFGTVYLGNLEATQVAVKILSQTSIQGYKEFQTEVELLLRVHHRNLTSLVGYCDDGDKMALIYELMANGDLRENLSGKRSSRTLSWEDRLRIALESAQGLEYLHHGCKPPIVHRDVKSTNILLNEHFEAKLADFGLSRSFPLGGQAFVSTVVAGTPGYLDPDYYRTNWLTEKSDVYSFGIVILDLITNQPVIDQKRVKPHLGEWVALLLGQGDIRKIVDPSLRKDIDANSVWKVVEIAMSCIRQTSKERPSMAEVVIELKDCLREETARLQGSGETDYSTDSAEVALYVPSQLYPKAR